MIYIKLIENKEKLIENKRIIHIINLIKQNFSKIKEEKFENKTLVIMYDTEKKTLNKLNQYIRKNCINRVCLSNNLLKNADFIENIKKENIKIFDGKWLFKQLMYNCTEYVCKLKKENLAYQEISILSNHVNEVVIENIRELASKVKIVNIITNDDRKFKKIEKELYEEKGIILNINNNYKKSLIKSDIIFNFDFNEEEINKFILPKKCCIINFNEKIKINIKSFEGINVDFFEIMMPRKYLKNSICLNDFDNSILYESYIYKNTSCKNIRKEIQNDGVNITFLCGKSGKIRKNEYLNLSKKIAN